MAQAAWAGAAASARRPGARLAAGTPATESAAPGPRFPGWSRTSRPAPRRRRPRAPAAGTRRTPATARDTAPSVRSSAWSRRGAIATQQRVRRPGRGHDRPGHRRIRLGPQWPGHRGSQPVRDQGHRPGGSDSPSPRNTRTASWVTKVAPFRVYRDVAESIERPCPAAGHQRLLPPGHGRAGTTRTRSPPP